ncbi:MAG: putative acetyltransferase [Rhodobacteraceae bacterium HLUCCA08]|nr:MAG: putative acetyltransferase [Rhodobacteraceae bacterium HLUCCA08]
MRIERIEEARLNADDTAAIARLLDRAFGPEFGGRSFFQQRHHVRLVARDPGIVGHMALGLRDVRLGDDLVTIACLGDVATDPDRRGEGIATRLMQAVLAESRAMPAAFLVLFGDQPLYAGTGFVSQRNPMIWTDLTDARTGPVERGRDDGLMVLPLGDMSWDPDAPLDLLGWKF